MTYLMVYENFDYNFDWNKVLKRDKSEKWKELEKEVMQLIDKHADDFGVDSYGIVDALYQILDGMFQKKNDKR